MTYQPELRSIPLTPNDCECREKKFFLEPYCQYGTDNGWYETEDGEMLKAFLHPCSWKCITKGCPKGFAV
jgi:hypothetical protein